MEQTFKISEYELASEADLKKVVSDTFVREALHRFEEMQRSLDNATNAV